jgi:flagellar hook-length control protein FliK
MNQVSAISNSVMATSSALPIAPKAQERMPISDTSPTDFKQTLRELRADTSRVQKSVAKKPVTEKPLNEKPLNEKPTNKQPINKKPIGGKSMGERSVDEKSVGEKHLAASNRNSGARNTADANPGNKTKAANSTQGARSSSTEKSSPSEPELLAGAAEVDTYDDLDDLADDVRVDALDPALVVLIPNQLLPTQIAVETEFTFDNGELITDTSAIGDLNLYTIHDDFTPQATGSVQTGETDVQIASSLTNQFVLLESDTVLVEAESDDVNQLFSDGVAEETSVPLNVFGKDIDVGNPALTQVERNFSEIESLSLGVGVGSMPLKTKDIALDSVIAMATQEDSNAGSQLGIVSESSKVFEKMLSAMSDMKSAGTQSGQVAEITSVNLGNTLSDSNAGQGSLARPVDLAASTTRSFVVNPSVAVPVGQPQWSQAVGEKVLWLAAQNVTSAEIRLDPPELGPLQVRVSVHQDQASVSFTSHHSVVREALDQNLNRLRELFGEQGIDLMNVDVSDKSFKRQQNENEEGSNRSSLGALADDETAIAESIVVHTRLVDHYA